MKLVCTYCSGPKRDNGGLLPAVDRYLSERIGGLRDLAAANEDGFAILSGEYGLLAADEPIPWYDHLLEPHEVEMLAVRVAEQLLALAPDSVEYHTANPRVAPAVEPYGATLQRACVIAGLPLSIRFLAGDPA